MKEAWRKSIICNKPLQAALHAGIVFTPPLGVYDEVSHFNIGASASIKTLEKMGISSGDYCLLGCTLADKQRVRSANRNSEESKKKRRRMIRPEEKPKETSRSKNKGRNMPVENFKL